MFQSKIITECGCIAGRTVQIKSDHPALDKVAEMSKVHILFKNNPMAKYNTIEDLDIVLESANNISKVSYNGSEWTIEYKNDLPADTFASCREMLEFLIADQRG